MCIFPSSHLLMLLVRRAHFETTELEIGYEAHGFPVLEQNQVSLSKKRQWEGGRAIISIYLSYTTCSNLVPVTTWFQCYSLKGS